MLNGCGILIWRGLGVGRKRESLREKNLGSLWFFSFKRTKCNQSTISGLDIIRVASWNLLSPCGVQEMPAFPPPTASKCLLRTSVAGMTARRREIPDNPAGSANRLPFWNDGMRTNHLPFRERPYEYAIL